MSISGDSIIMRNGRATSQVSIYNYPEHLNPFYEEDQHKRLRFWHVNKNKDNNDRWKSISITSLKDLWPLKSFRLSKKKSSTLGINKTSESPPLLRRDCIDYNNTPYRNTMLNGPLPTRATSMGLERFEPYRSTIQVMGGNQTLPFNKRYNYGRSFTPQPQRSNMLETPNLSRRSGSRTSTTSTNPFEDSDEDYDVSVEQFFDRHQRLTQSLMPTQRKKKRRAPIPDALRNKTNKNVENTLNSEANSSQHMELRIEEDADLNISNLATEIQNFVDTSLQSEENALVHTPTKCNGEIAPRAQSTPKLVIETEFKKEQTTTITETTTRTVNKKKKDAEDVTKIPETKVEAISSVKQEIKLEEPLPKIQRNVEILYKPNENCNNGITVKTPFILTTPPTPTPLPEIKIETERVEEQPVLRDIVILGPLTGPEKPKRSSLTKRTAEFLQSEQLTNQATEAKTTKKQNEETIATTVAPATATVPLRATVPVPAPIAAQQPEVVVKVEIEQNVTPLKIVESVESLNAKITQLKQPQQTITTTTTATTTTITASSVESTGAIPRTREWKDSSLAPLQATVPPEKRKSAKEIIESIERQQRLLKEAAERNMPETRNRLPCVITYNHYKQTATNSNDLDQSQSAVKQQNGHGFAQVDNEFRDPQKLENGTPVFAKCRVYKENYPQRESSPTTSNLDWNPLPKPKRNKDFQLD